MFNFWRSLSLIERIRWVRYLLPLALVPFVVVYQFQIAFRLEEQYGHPVHYAAEIALYSFVGPVVLWFTLGWVERNLAEKETLERQVRARTQQLASLTTVSSDAILTLDRQGRIISWNQGAERLFGYTPDEIAGHTLDVLFPDAEQIQHEAEIQHFETNARTREGQSITVDLTQNRLEQEEEGAPVSLLIMRDITARRERAAILEEERARIARDLHDGVAQSLYFMALKADMSRQQVQQDPGQSRIHLKEIGQEARGAIRDVRRAIFGLTPLDWAKGEFLPELQRFINEFAEQVGWQLKLRIDVDEQVIPIRLEPTVFRLVQESLNNVAKHAHAEIVEIQLRLVRDPLRLLLSVYDDGRGFDPETTPRGVGINQMQRRVAATGGTFTLNSQPGTGTQISVEIPIRGEESNG